MGAPAPLPLVLFLHGRHSTCYGLDPEPFVTGDWPCPEGTLPIPSHQGYRYVAELLASQGYLTVSIAANGINGQDGWVADGGAAARSALIRHHLGLWVDWNTAGGDPWGGIFQGAVDLDHVVLVGHSRGGEGVERAAIDATPADGYTIVGLVPIGPTSFGRQVGAGIATAVILPYCDGDVVRPAGPGLRRPEPRPHPRPGAALGGDGDRHQPQLLQHRVDPRPGGGPRRRRLAVGRAGRRAHLRARRRRAG